MGKKRKFIDKRQAETFRIISRSQKDPLIVDEDAPQHVLLPMENKEKKVQIDLPPSVFPSEVEEKVGMLNRAAPHSALVLDPDLMEVYAAVDSDFDCSEAESDIEDYLNDVVKFGGGEVKDDVDDQTFDINIKFSDEEEGLDDLTDLVETKSRFTDYSMTSSVIRRNEQLQLLDAKFEQMCLEYDEDEIGALDSQEIKGDGNSTVIQQVLDEYEKKKKEDVYENPGKYFDYESGEEEYEYIKVKPKEKWDCVSILSKNSSRLFNHPKIISTPPVPKKIRVDSKGVPVDDNRLTERNLAHHDGEKNKASGRDSIASAVTVLSRRSKNETSLEKRNRKKAFRMFKRERRIEKKMNKEAFKEAEKKMVKERLHNNNTKYQVVNL